MKKPNVALAIVLAGGASVAQTKGAVKESGKAVAEKAMEGKESVQAAATTDPAKKSVHKGSAKSHKATAPKRDRKAKAAGWIGLGDEAGARTAVVLQTLRRNLGTISQWKRIKFSGAGSETIPVISLKATFGPHCRRAGGRVGGARPRLRISRTRSRRCATAVTAYPMTSPADLRAGRLGRRPLSLDVPVVVEIVDAELPGGNQNRMHITVWVDAANESVSQPSAARSLTIGFLERVLETLRARPGNSFVDTEMPGSIGFVKR